MDYRSGCFRVQGTKNLIKTNVETEKLKKIWNQWLVDGFPHLALSHVQCTQFNHRMPGKQLSVSVSLSLCSLLFLPSSRGFYPCYLLKEPERKSFSFTAVATAVTCFSWLNCNCKINVEHDTILSLTIQFQLKWMEINTSTVFNKWRRDCTHFTNEMLFHQFFPPICLLFASYMYR